MNLSKNHQIPLSKIYICLCQKKHIYPYQKFAFTFIFFLHFILTGTIEKQKRIYRDSNTLTTEIYKKSISILKEEKNNLLKPRLERLQLLEELIDEMAAEVIREDMKKNNVTLSEFVKGMRYFKPEDEEKIEDFEIVD